MTVAELPGSYRWVTDGDGAPIVLGRPGRFGTVMKAVAVDLDRPVAVKVIARALLAIDEGWIATSAVREAVVLSRLNHPNIIRVFDLFEDDAHVMIVMELAGGGTLEDVAKEEVIDLRRCVRWLEECARGLAHLHGSGLIHRDLKPTNVLLSADGVAKLGDLGLATSAELRRDPLDAAIRGRIAGTPPYSSPEQDRGDELTPASDVYSFGMLATELLGPTLPAPSGRQRRSRRSNEDLAALVYACRAQVSTARPRDGDELLSRYQAAIARTPGLSDRHRRPTSGTSPRVGAITIAPDKPLMTVVPTDGRSAVPAAPVAASHLSPVTGQETVVPPVDRRHPRGPRPGSIRRPVPGIWIAIAALVVGASVGTFVAWLVLDRDEPMLVRSFFLDVPVENDCPVRRIRATATVTTAGGGGRLVIEWRRPDGALTEVQPVDVPTGDATTTFEFTIELDGTESVQGVLAAHMLQPLDAWTEPAQIDTSCGT